MHDDDLERKLHVRLRAYESAIPDADPPPPGTSPGRPKLTVAVFGGAVVALGVASILGFAVLGSRPDRVGSATQTPSPSHDETTSASPSPSAPALSPRTTPTPTPVPTIAPAISGLPTAWSVAATFREAGAAMVVGDMTSWSGGLVSVGTRYGSDTVGPFGPPPDPVGRIWTSSDGVGWVDATPDATFAGVELHHVFTTVDGALVAIGRVMIDATSFTQQDLAWESRNGTTWAPTQLGSIPESVLVGTVTQGRRGYLLAGSEPAGGSGSVWYSADGRVWHEALDLADYSTEGSPGLVVSASAGDEGFATIIATGEGHQTYSVVASGDGSVWVEGALPEGQPSIVASRGPDWLAMESFSENDDDYTDGLTVRTWLSANGLTWAAGSTITLGTWSDGGTTCSDYPTSAATRASATYLSTTLSYPCSEGGFATAGGAWASEDAITWVELPFGDLAGIRGAEVLNGRVIVATDVGTGAGRDAGVTFWIGQD